MTLRHIGRYDIVDKLGQGAMANVYKAFDPNINRTLAIKVLKEDKCIDPEYRIRFLREARAAGNLSHPNIVTIHDVGEVDNRPYITMEMIEGTPLDILMKQPDSLSMEEILNIGISLAKALDYAHVNGIVHRDIKPSNIIYSKARGVAKITDFGIAHVENTELTQQTQMGDILGTPQYMSPEQVLSKKVDGRSDLFSLGVILYQLLTKQKPFSSTTLTTLLFQIATDDPKPIETYRTDLPKGLVQIIEKLLKKDPAKRFQNGNELAAALISIHKQITGQEMEKPNLASIRFKWSIIMAVVVTCVMGASAAIIYSKQYRMIESNVFDYGSSLIKFIAKEAAVPILSEDWVTIELFVDETKNKQNFSYITVIDHRNIIRGDDNVENIGKPFAPRYTDALTRHLSDVSVNAYTNNLGSDIFDFEAPVLFQEKEIGRVHLGIPKSSLTQTANVTMYLLAALLAVTIVAVFVSTFLMGARITQSLKIVESGLNTLVGDKIAERISDQRQDEFGKLYAAFNKLVDKLNKKIQ